MTLIKTEVHPGMLQYPLGMQVKSLLTAVSTTKIPETLAVLPLPSEPGMQLAGRR